MNVLILTPDRVGSTLLQRLLTIYMLRKDFGQPVINLHELVNGLTRYYNPVIGQEVLGKPDGVNWGYHQTLSEIQELLSSVSHYKTSRLAHYHLINRQDSLNDQLKFYEYLNNNFYIISCRRENLFEHGLSWAIQAHSKKLNVYSPQEKINDFQQIYANGITVNREGFEKYLNNYVKYIKWSDAYFNIQSYFDYDTHMHNIEDYIINLDFMRDHNPVRWEDMFGQSFEEYNACHRLVPNLFLHNRTVGENTRPLTVGMTHVPDTTWQQIRGPDWPDTYADFKVDENTLPVVIRDEITQRLGFQTVQVTEDEYQFLSRTLPNYKQTIGHIEKLKDDGYMVTGIPLKLQSLQEKRSVIRNFNDCVEWYNQWVGKNNFGKPYSTQELDAIATSEESKLNQPIQQQLTYSQRKLLGS